MDDDAKKIRIKDVQGGDSRDQQALKRNYFYPTGENNTYQFFDPGNDPIVTEPPVVAEGVDFSFSLKEMPGVTWNVSQFEINDQVASGKWNNTARIELEDGSFQAQAGPTFEEVGSSASAS